MKFEKLPEEMKRGLLKGTRKTLVIGTLVFSAIFFGIAALIASVGHSMWVIAIFPALIGAAGLINLLIELKAPVNFFDKSIKTADYSLNPSEAESN